MYFREISQTTQRRTHVFVYLATNELIHTLPSGKTSKKRRIRRSISHRKNKETGNRGLYLYSLTFRGQVGKLLTKIVYMLETRRCGRRQEKNYRPSSYSLHREELTRGAEGQKIAQREGFKVGGEKRYVYQ